MQYVQLVLTDQQVGLLGASVQNAITDAGSEQEAEHLAALAYFLDAVAQNPSAFPVRTPAMRRSIKKQITAAKGTSQPQGGANKRKRTQARKIGFQKRTRATKRAEAAAQREAFVEYLRASEAQARVEGAVEEKSRGLGIILPSRRRKRAE